MRTDRSLVLTFSLTNLVNVTITWLLFVVFPLHLRQELGFSEGKVGVLISIYVYTMLFAMAPLGYLSDKVSPKRLVQAGVVGKTLYCLGISQVSSYGWLQPLQVLGGAAEALSIICLVSLYYKNLSPKRRGRSIGLFGAAGFLGYALGPILNAGLRRARLTYDSVFLVMTGISVLLLLMTLALRDSKPIRFRVFEYVKDVRRPEVLIMAIVLIGVGVHFGVERKSYALVLTRRVGLDDAKIALLFTSAGVFNCLSTYAIGHWFDRSKRMLYFMVAGLVLSGCFQIVTPYARGLGQIVGIRIIHLLGDALVLFGLNVLTASIFPQHRMGGSSGFMYVLRLTGTVIGATAAGILDVRWPSYGASFLFSGLVIIAVGTAFVIGHRTMRRLRRKLTMETEEGSDAAIREDAGGAD